MDPNNPRILYAGFWQVVRRPWELVSGGPGSSLWRSTDGGDNWKKIALPDADGLPEGIWGKVGVAASGARPGRVYAFIEAAKGGLFVSEDGGEKWKYVNDEHKVRERAWYYSWVYPDPRSADTLTRSAPASRAATLVVSCPLAERTMMGTRDHSRSRRITSPARFPSRTIRRAASRASSRSGTSLASQRRHALPLLTMPESGWLTSCAIEAVSSPMVVRRIHRAPRQLEAGLRRHELNARVVHVVELLDRAYRS